MANAETGVLHSILTGIQGIAILFRNNVGAAKTDHGMIQYGVGGPGASDLIGYVPVIITPAMVGKRVAVFAAVEVKAPGAHTDPARLAKQQHFVGTVKAAGGIAGFADSLQAALAILKRPIA